jgi:hypothetical protein
VAISGGDELRQPGGQAADIATALGLQVIDDLGGHQSGAWRVRSPDGQDMVLKCHLGASTEHALNVASHVERLRATGVLTPAILKHGVLGGVGWSLQEYVAEAVHAPPDTPTGQAVLRLGRACGAIELPLDPAWWRRLLTRLTDGRPGWMSPRAVAATSAAGVTIAARCAAVARAAETGGQPDACQLGHRDLVPGNVLRGPGGTWVVDWAHSGAVAPGYDLATFGAWTQATQPGPAGRLALDAAFAQAGDREASVYVHHAALWCGDAVLEAATPQRDETFERLLALLDQLT